VSETSGSSRPQLEEASRLAFGVIVSHKMRSGLLILGVTIGVAVLMTMVSILMGLSEKIERDVTSSDKAVITLSKYDFMTEGDPEDDRILARPDITPEDAKAIEELCPSVDVAEFYIDANRFTTLRYGDERTRPVGVAGGGPRLPYVYSFKIEHGRYFNDAELLTRADVIVLGHGPADELFPDVDPIGKRVRLGDEHYRVIGVFGERKSIFGNFGENFAVIPWTTFKKNWGQRYDPYFLYMTVREGSTVEQVEEEARAVMRARHRLRPGEEDDFDLISNDRINEFVKRITGPIGLILLVLSSIGLTVGGIGVMNIMLVSVTERTKEIGLRMALGAHRRTILVQFLVEAGTLTGVGGVLGVLFGAALATIIGRATSFPAVIHPLAALVGVVFSCGIGIFFGLYPASRAAKLDPIEALRYE
jgi:putative ABC transport system permease protein